MFESQLRHAELNRLGADIRIKGNNAIVRECRSCQAGSGNLRASAALVLAALAAKGKTTNSDCIPLDQGHDQLETQSYFLTGAGFTSRTKFSSRYG